ncbi:thiol-disulfide oxidoreductase DCC family protein [Oceanobacillus bengalensis]|uniref:Thiol-disulfide oxidoreductase DCC family protein n=1 Tax=Oceanobacillus bengalensis TaxID=1435466 RepID=A0A494YXU2_9BACI|nr:thiol-disulfide oxidoreductase DCC family protein [Oceanobacillus bengalensis]RKQ14943.1 thiol-disulfide oxidoreductase DCC family protein [Oceanobacillus bengalensis]
MDNIILFDGECNLCDSSVRFIINRDKGASFTFASLQSEIGKELLERFGVSKEMDSFVLLTNGKYYDKSTAALRVCAHLSGMWKLLSLFLIVPRPIRDYLYTIIASNRYKWFGKKENCMIPTPEIRKRFL